MVLKTYNDNSEYANAESVASDYHETTTRQAEQQIEDKKMLGGERVEYSVSAGSTEEDAMMQQNIQKMAFVAQANAQCDNAAATGDAGQTGCGKSKKRSKKRIKKGTKKKRSNKGTKKKQTKKRSKKRNKKGTKKRTKKRNKKGTKKSRSKKRVKGRR